MHRSTDRIHQWIVSLAILMLCLVVWGCSEDHGVVNSVSQEGSQAAEFTYPLLTPEHLQAGPCPGYRFFTGTESRSALDDPPVCDSLSAARWLRSWQGGTVGVNGLVTVSITSGDLPSSTTIRVVAPLGECTAVADFYPHPYLFNGQVEIRWNISAFNLPSDFDFDSLVPFYVNDNGQYEAMPFTWQNGHSVLVVYTNHFSRYIVGQGTQ